MEVEQPVPEKEQKPTTRTDYTKKENKTEVPSSIFSTKDFEKAYAVEQPAIMTLIDEKLKEDVQKLLKEEYKLDIKDWRKWHNLLFAYAFAIKEAFLAENTKVYGEKASEQLLFLANLYRKSGK
jgi:hypothetical protein